MVTKNRSKSNWKVISLSAILVGSLIGSVVYLLIDRHRPHEYVCQIVGMDLENNMMGMKCMYR